MTNEQDPSFETLVDEFNDVEQTFREQAAKNRRQRINGEPEKRQETYGDQPERQFNPEVYLLVPHNNISPGVATFPQNIYTGITNSTGSVTVELTDTSVATVRFQKPNTDYWDVEVTVVDSDNDGTVTIDIELSKTGQSRHDGTEVFSAGTPGDTIRDVTRHEIPGNRIDEGKYDLTASVNGTQTDVATLEKRRSTSGNSGSSGNSGGSSASPPQAEYRQRPLPRRPAASPPLHSSGVTVRRNGGRTETIEPGKNYTVDIEVQNAGGLAAHGATVELYVDHLTPDATIDASGPFEAEQYDFSLTGTTTLPPGHKLVAVAYEDSGGTLTADNLLFRSKRGHAQVDAVGETVDEDRTFLFDVPGPPYSGSGNVSNLRARIYWTTGIDLTKDKYYPDTTQAKQRYIQTLKNRAVELTDKEGTVVNGALSNPKGKHDLESTIHDATLLPQGKRTERVPASDATTVSFDYTAPAARGDRVLTVFHARTYSLAPEDMPSDWDKLDHTKSRFMGRTELNWAGASAD
jgi:hypothetical protein